MLAPQSNSYTAAAGIPSFPIPYLRTDYASSYTPPQPSASVQNTSTSRTSFRPPAHKHAHHLHSIPPREKSTRTLIIDHMLWVHGRTRFAQARAELGMTDRTGGPSSSNYLHRFRPENYEEEREQNSEGEGVITLKARAGDPHHPPGDDEDKRLQSQDLGLARNLRLRAEGLEKVVTSMLGQPPTVHIWDGEDIWTPPTSPPLQPKNHNVNHPHKLPNGVRLRLALGTIVNDLFARQAPPSPYRHRLQSKSPSQSPSNSPRINITPELPAALGSLSTVCATGTDTSRNTNDISSANQHLAGERRIPTLSTRTRSLYNAGADPSTANSPPSLRCPRHLHTGCEICVEAKTGARPSVGNRGRSASLGDYRGGQGNLWRATPGRPSSGARGISGWQDGSGVGSGLLRPGVDGNCLRRKISGLDDGESSTGSGNTKLSELIPRFIRLSALVASELAMEAKDTQDDSSSTRSKDAAAEQPSGNDSDWVQQQRSRGDFQPLPGPMSPNPVRTSNQPHDRVYDLALRPTREWYLLLAGLLTRAALEGYLTAGWRGPQAVECLLTVGLGAATAVPHDRAEATGFEEFDPDGLPSLLEAAKLLFPTLQSSQKGVQAEEEYEIQMQERLRRFYDIPSSTPDLSTHMEDLAWQYPAEPVERAALRFCEAIARWRGKPELETYKKPTHQNLSYGFSQDMSGSSSLSIDSLVHSNPPSPTIPRNAPVIQSRRPLSKPSIDVYFSQPSPSREGFWSPGKRTRSPDGSRPGPSKRFNAG